MNLNNLLWKIQEFILNLWRKKDVDGASVITSDKFMAAIHRDLDPNFFYVRDSNYKPVTMQQMKDFLAEDLLDKKKYETETFDCDEFAFSLMGRLADKFGNIPAGIVWGSGHALNFFYEKDQGVIWMLEPQTDQIYFRPKEFKVDVVMC